LRIQFVTFVKAEFVEVVPKPVMFLANWITIPRTLDALRTLKSIETGVYVPYSRLPRPHELILIGALLLVLVVIFALLSAVVRALFCRGKKTTSSASAPKKSKKD
jgi:hypothetical protein